MNRFTTLFLASISALCSSMAGPVGDLRFVDTSIPLVERSIRNLAVGDLQSLVLATNKVGGAAFSLGRGAGLRFEMTATGPIGITSPRGLAGSASEFFVCGDSGMLALGSPSAQGVAWTNWNIGQNYPLTQVGLVGSNLVVLTPSRVTLYGQPKPGTTFKPSTLISGSIVEVLTAIQGFSDGTGAVLGGYGLVRYSKDNGATWSVARAAGSSPSSVEMTDAVRLDDTLFVTATDGSVFSSKIPTNAAPGASDWKWTSTKVAASPLRSATRYGTSVVVVGDAGAAFERVADGTWLALTNFPGGTGVAHDWVGVEAAESGEFIGTIVLASRSSVFIGGSIPAPVVLNPQHTRIGTCVSDPVGPGKFFEAVVSTNAPLGRFMEVDWIVDGRRQLTNSSIMRVDSTFLDPFSNRVGTWNYSSVARDYRTGLDSAPSDVTQVVYQNPQAPESTAPGGVFAQCAADPVRSLTLIPVPGVSFEWFTTEIAGEKIATGNAYTPPSATPVTVFVESVQVNELETCRSTNRTRIRLEVYPNPSVPISSVAGGVFEQCASDAPLTLSVDPVEGVTFDWFDAEVGGNKIASGTSYTPPVAVTKLFFVEAIRTYELETCRSTSRARIELRVYPNPAPPVATITDGIFNQCASDPTRTLSVLPVEGVAFDWYEAPGGGVPISQGDQFTPAKAESAAYYVEAVQKMGGVVCRSLERTRVELKINPNPLAPNVPAKVSIASCEEIPSIAATPVPGINTVWYAQSAGGVWTPVSTNASFTPSQKVTSRFHVEAVDALTGCTSTNRAEVFFEVRPVVEVSTTDVLVLASSSNKVTQVTATTSTTLESHNTVVWKTDGDGKFSATNTLTVEYSPGQADLVRGSVNLTVTVADNGAACATSKATSVVTYESPTLVAAVSSTGELTLTWLGGWGFVLQSAPDLSFQKPVDLANGDSGKWSGNDLGSLQFFRLVRK